MIDVAGAPRMGKGLAFLGLSIALFVACLLFDGFYIEGSDPRAWADTWLLLLIGWIGILAGLPYWFANPLLIGAWIALALGKRKSALILSGVALGLALLFLLERRILVSEAPTYAAVTGYGAGYWLWVASMAAAFASALYGGRPKAGR
jgi:hypothetical protein